MHFGQLEKMIEFSTRLKVRRGLTRMPRTFEMDVDTEHTIEDAECRVCSSCDLAD